MPTPGRSTLFSGTGNDRDFLAVRDNDCFADIQAECERLWNSYAKLTRQDFVNRFSQDFRACFWEMYLGVLLREFHPGVTAPQNGPDFTIRKDTTTFVEATTASRGNGVDAVPDISVGSDDDDSVPTNECILRVTSSLRTKAFEENHPIQHAAEGPYVIAINLLFPEAWVGDSTPLSAQATLGVGNLLFSMSGNDGGFTNHNPSIRKQYGGDVITTAFQDPHYDHVSALLVAGVNPFSSTYYSPAMEFLHNPRATKPLPREWLPVGTEYWVEGNNLRKSDHGNPTEAIALSSGGTGKPSTTGTRRAGTT